MELTSEWLSANRLNLNKKKTHLFTFGLKQTVSNDLSSIGVLGLILDSKLTWTSHTDLVIKKLSRVVYLIQRLKPLVSTKTLLMAYHAYFHSLLAYGVELWGNSAGCNEVFLLQKRVIRVLAGAEYRAHCKPIFKDLKILTFPSLYIVNIILYTWKFRHSFRTRGDTHQYTTRGHTALEIPWTRLETIKRSYKVIGITLLNKLPRDSWELSREKLRTVLKAWLVDIAPYSINEVTDFDWSRLRDNLRTVAGRSGLT